MTETHGQAEATLLLAGHSTAAAGSPSAQTVLLGLPLARRTALAARRAGFDRVYALSDGTDPIWTVLDGTGARPFPRDAAEAALPAGRIVLLPDRVVATPQWLRSLREAPAEPGRLNRLAAGAIVETADPALLGRTLGRHSDLWSVMSEWAAALSPARAAPDVVAPLEVTADSDLATAETFLLKSLVKKQDGLLESRINRKISLAVTRRLASTRVTPNAMTFFCVGLGLAAAASFASPALGRQIAGGILFLMHSILDGCDGELARLKFKESRLGGVLDFWGDNVVHVAVFSAFALAWSRANGQTWPFALAALAVTGTILSAGFVYMYAMRPKTGGGPLLTTVSPSRRSRLTEALDVIGRRDFIYLVMVLALFGKAYWFLATAAVGTPGFFVALLIMALGGRASDGAGKAPPGPGWPGSGPGR
jgi:phosphatidylglycerophosphate synthase